MGASIRDVAVEAGVSVATVSRALRGLPNVAPSTRERVLAAAEALDYVADPHATRLSTGRSRTIGVVAPQVTQWFFNQVVSGAEAILTAAGYDVMLYTMSGARSQPSFFVDEPFRKRVDGLILVQVPAPDMQHDVLSSLRVPAALVGVQGGELPSVTIDNVAAARVATRHLVNLGHERIALLAGRPLAATDIAWAGQRRAGYQQALAEAGLAAPAEYDVAGNFSMHGGAEAMAQLLSTERIPTAVFVESDEMAIGALKTVRDVGLRVPDDISIVGFDDHEMAEFLGLTTVHQPVVEQGQVAAELLLERLDDPACVRDVVLPTKLILRSTTSPRRPDSVRQSVTVAG